MFKKKILEALIIYNSIFHILLIYKSLSAKQVLLKQQAPILHNFNVIRIICLVLHYLPLLGFACC